MSKMFAAIDEPSDCFECPLLNKGLGLNNQCSLSKRWIGSIDLTKRPDWCLLKHLPEKLSKLAFECDYDWGYRRGWNNCIEEILGE